MVLKKFYGGISHAGGIAVAGNDLIVADIQSVKAYSLIDDESWNYKMYLGFSSWCKYISLN